VRAGTSSANQVRQVTKVIVNLVIKPVGDLRPGFHEEIEEGQQAGA